MLCVCVCVVQWVFVRVGIENVFSNYDILDDCDAYSPSSTLLDLQSPRKPISGCIHQIVSTKGEANGKM